LFDHSESKRSRVLLYALTFAFSVLAYHYYDVVNSLVHRSDGSKFTPPQAKADEVCRQTGASWRAVSITGADGVVLKAWLMQPPQPNGKAVLLLHHLYGSRLRLLPEAYWLLKNGYTCLLPDSRGHGASGGAVVTFGILERYDVAEWVRLLRREPAIHDVYGIGISMGASVLIQSLAVPVDFRAIVADSTAADMAHPYDYAADRFDLPVAVIRPISWPLVAPAFWNARFRYNVRLEGASPLSAIRGSHVPVLLMHGLRDWLIPVEQARRLHDANPDYTTIWEVPGGRHGHLDWDEAAYRTRVLEWFGSH
jgi:pimeloyl-ACP methyl ester carboxylesterase